MTQRRDKESFDNYEITNNKQREIVEALKTDKYLWNFFIGNPGTGKGHLAMAKCKQVYEKGKTIPIYTTNFAMLRECQSDFINEADALTKYSAREFLVIDECEKFWKTKQGNEINIFFEIINERYENYLPMIFISNIKKWGGLMEVMGKDNAEALSDRIAEMGRVWEFDWPSYRQGGGK